MIKQQVLKILTAPGILTGLAIISCALISGCRDGAKDELTSVQ